MNYAIGDVQGDLTALKRLLNRLSFNLKKDKLFFLGDIVNRGNQSLETLLFIKQLVEQNNARLVLGNHDYHLLVCGYTGQKLKPQDTMGAILKHPDKESLLNFLRYQPLLIEHGNNILVHAGIPPQWSIKTAISRAKLVQKKLQAPLSELSDFLSLTYQDNANHYSDDLTQIEKSSYTVNALMRMRFCKADGELEFNHNKDQTTAPIGFKAWFEYSNSITENIVFGHWSRLNPIDQTQYPTIYALDTGCIWGGQLSAICLESKQIFSIDC